MALYGGNARPNGAHSKKKEKLSVFPITRPPRVHPVELDSVEDMSVDGDHSVAEETAKKPVCYSLIREITLPPIKLKRSYARAIDESRFWTEQWRMQTAVELSNYQVELMNRQALYRIEMFAHIQVPCIPVFDVSSTSFFVSSSFVMFVLLKQFFKKT